MMWSIPLKRKMDVTLKTLMWGCGCGSIGRAVAYDTRGPQFESNHRQILCVHSVNCIEKTKINRKEAGSGPI